MTQLKKAPSRAKPRYAIDRRELWFKGKLVKQFRQMAPNQERVLLDFEEHGWPERIDDPMAGGKGAKQRLHDTIKNLNHNQREKPLHFFADGTGTGIRWRAV